MKLYKYKILSLIVIMSVFCISCNKINRETRKDKDIEQIINSMSLDEKIGQMIITGIKDQKLKNQEVEFLVRNNVGGIILFSRNIANSDQLKRLIQEVKQVEKKVGFFISIDEEGGMVSRLPSGKVIIPNSYYLGGMDNPRISKEVARVIAEELRDYGINMNNAPVLDVWSNPDNKVIGERAFGTEPHKVAKYGIEAVNGYKEKGIISVVKHFPGHGDTRRDSHIEMPKIDLSMNDLIKRELIPFVSAIENNVDAIMIGHLNMANIDSEYPASLSEKLVDGLLRKKLGYHGVVVTDDLDMGAIRNSYSKGGAGVKAVQAGCDIMLICHDHQNVEESKKQIIEAVNQGVIDIERINDSVRRILLLKRKYGIRIMEGVYEEKSYNRL